MAISHRSVSDGTDAATDRIVQVVVPAPYELEGRTYPARSFNLEQLLPGKAGEMFSFCGYNGSFTTGMVTQ